jgi:hypothetical protein
MLAESKGLIRSRFLGKMANNCARQKTIDLQEVEVRTMIGRELLSHSNGKANMVIPSQEEVRSE